MTISISSLVIGCGLLFLAGVFTGISIMCMLSVRKNRRLNENYFVSDSDTHFRFILYSLTASSSIHSKNNSSIEIPITFESLYTVSALLFSNRVLFCMRSVNVVYGIPLFFDNSYLDKFFCFIQSSITK